MAEVRYDNFDMDSDLTGYFDVDAGNTLVNAPQDETKHTQPVSYTHLRAHETDS